jgi:ribosomal protein S18 acetylase RimI-like enzyme
MTAQAVVAEPVAGERPLLVPDAWLSKRLLMPAFTLQESAEPHVRPEAAPAFVQARVELHASDRVSALIRSGYSLVETAVRLEMDVARKPRAPRSVRFACSDDESAVRQISASAFMHSRFHRDPLISRQLADRIKADWAGNFFTGNRGTHMVVKPSGKGVDGFLLLIARAGELIIDLVGVAPHAQGRGIGRAMLDFAVAGIPEVSRLVVGTQVHNTASLAYYSSYGMRIARSNHALHLHVR